MNINWETVYSGVAARDHHMECCRLRCKECGGFQEGCTCDPDQEVEFCPKCLGDARDCFCMA